VGSNLGKSMTGLASPSGTDEIRPVVWKLRSLGLEGEAESQALSNLIRLRVSVSRGKDILRAGSSPAHLTVLLDGTACSYERLEHGGRQIHAFHHPGDFCDFHRDVWPEPNDRIAVAALTDCLVGAIRYKDLDQTLARHPKLGLALWRASMLEMSICRERLLNVSRRPARQRVAHLLCEQLARREAVGINDAVIPLSQTDLAEAAGLSVMHLNRTVHALRTLGVLSRETAAIEVTDREQLLQLANFDAHYLDMPEKLAGWRIDTDGPFDQAKVVSTSRVQVGEAAG
jgi:CRP-like cAMP-binding protein